MTDKNPDPLAPVPSVSLEGYKLVDTSRMAVAAVYNGRSYLVAGLFHNGPVTFDGKPEVDPDEELELQAIKVDIDGTLVVTAQLFIRARHIEALFLVERA